jgi:hypothetical protein
MLTGLRLGNFKAFADTQYIPIRPLTLIFGANSAGKSSLIHSLLLACHVSETGELDIHRTRVGGESVDLGGFRQYIHRRNYGNSTEYSIELDIAQLRGRLAEILAPGRRATVTVTIGIQLDDKGIPKANALPEVQIYEIAVDGSSLLRMSRRPEGTLQLDRLEQHHPILQSLTKAILETTTTTESIRASDLDGINRAMAEFVPHISARIDGLFPRGVQHFGSREQSVEGKVAPKRATQGALFEEEITVAPIGTEEPMLFPVSQGRREEDLANAIRFFLPRTIDELIRGLREAAVHELSRLQYLGPLRSYPPRHIAFAQHHDQNWFAGGGYAWDEVRKNKQVREAVNAWLNAPDRLQTRYSLAIRELVGADDIQAPLSDMLEKAADLVNEEGVIPIFDDPESAAIAFVKRVSSELDKINELILMDNRTRTQVSHRDVGIGISQVLPVLVTAYASRNKILAMEQPEIHLHPALQAELGDVFIESALGERRNTMILETHSEHLMLRILRRIRETAANELPSNAIPIKPDDVAVLFIDATSSGSRVIEIPILPEGEFARQWPQGFFDDRAKELF